MYKEKCEDCRGVFGRFHLCTKYASTIVVVEPPRRAVHSKAGKASMAQAQRDRWEDYRQEQLKRIEDVVYLYTEEGLGLREVAERLKVSYTTVSRCVNTAVAEGRMKIRPRGKTMTPRASFSTKNPMTARAIIEEYKGGTKSVVDLAREYALTFHTVRKVLQTAEEAGELVVRGRGTPIKK